MDWNGILETIKNPVFIGAMFCAVAIIVLVILVLRTSVGKKTLDALSGMIPGLRKGIGDINIQINKFKDDSEKLAKLNQEFQAALIEKVNVLIAQEEYFEHSLIEIIALIPNEKVKAALDKFMVSWNAKKREVKELIGLSISELEEQLKSRDIEIERLKAEIDRVNEILKNVTNVGENAVYGETNEGTDN